MYVDSWYDILGIILCTASMRGAWERVLLAPTHKIKGKGWPETQYLESIRRCATEHSVKQEYTEHSVKQEYTEHSVKQEYTEHSVKQEYTEHSVKQEYTEHSVKQEYTEQSVKQEYMYTVTVSCRI